MSAEIIRFPSSGFVTIEGGVVQRSDRYEPGALVYFVSIEDEHGIEFGVWDGQSHADAWIAALEWGLPIRDRVGGGVG